MNSTISFILGVLITFSVSYYFYFKGRIDVCMDDLSLTRSELQLCNRENELLEDNDQELQLTIKKAEIETEYKIREIEDLNRKIEEKNTDVSDLKKEIKEKELKIEDNLNQLRKIIEEGATDEMKDNMNSLYKEIESLKNENAKLKSDKEKLHTEINKLNKKLIEEQREIQILKKVTLPEIQNKLTMLDNQLQIANKFQDFLNLRAEIQNIMVDNKRDIIQFDLVFEPQEIEYLKKNKQLSKFTFSPKIINETHKSYLIPAIEDFSDFTKQRTELSEFVTVTFPVSNQSLRKFKNGKKGINYSKGDLIKINVTLDELYNMEVANTSFYLN